MVNWDRQGQMTVNPLTGGSKVPLLGIGSELPVRLTAVRLAFKATKGKDCKK